jgi:hypothetical protein
MRINPTIDPTTQLAFSISANKGVYAILLGSGVSRSAGIPSGWEITLDLVRRVAITQDVEEQPDWEKWYRDTTGQEPNYSELLKELAALPAERRAILDRYIEPDEQDREEGRKIPTKAHHAIAQLVLSGHIRVIVTTNFDRLMENALREHGVEPTVVSSEDALRGAEPLTHSHCYLLKLHGDYKDARILNTDQELSVYPKNYNRLLERIFDEHGLIVCGWSGEWDNALRTALLKVRNRRYSMYWATLGTLGDEARKLVAHHKAKTIQITGADEFFQTLQQQIEILESSQRHDPQSVDLLVNSTKHYLSKPEYRIQLDDLFSQETTRLCGQLDNFQETQKDLRSRIQRYDSITEPLARMAGVLGRWGDDKESSLVLDVIRTLYRRTTGRTTDKSKRHPFVHSYPAVLVLTAYGIGLLKAERWQTSYQLFAATLPSSADHNVSQTVVSALLPQLWEGYDSLRWEEIEKIPQTLSEHLLEVMTKWQESFVGVEGNFVRLFDRFELMGSLADFDKHDESALKRELEHATATSSIQYLFKIPIGRVDHDASSACGLLQELEDKAFTSKLLQAGYAKGNERILRLFVKHFKFNLKTSYS